ncbi:hypothetical protein ACVWZB_004822 [Paenibacillus polymyxa]
MASNVKYQLSIERYSEIWDREHGTVYRIMEECGIQNTENELSSYFMYLQNEYRSADNGDLYQDIVEQMVNAVLEIFERLTDGGCVYTNSIYFPNRIKPTVSEPAQK